MIFLMENHPDRGNDDAMEMMLQNMVVNDNVGRYDIRLSQNIHQYSTICTNPRRLYDLSRSSNRSYSV